MPAKRNEKTIGSKIKAIATKKMDRKNSSTIKKDLVQIGVAIASQDYWKLAKTIWSNKKLRYAAVGLVILQAMFPLFIVVTIGSTTQSLLNHVLAVFSQSDTDSFKQKANAWEKTIKWVSGHDASGNPIYTTGLTEDQIAQVEAQGVTLSYGLIEAMKAFGATDIDKTIQILSPSAISFEQVTESTGSSNEKASTKQYWLLSSITTYNGVHHFKIENKSTSTEATQPNGTKTSVTTTKPVITGQDWTQDYSPLYMAERPLGISPNKEDQAFLFRQAMLYDPSFGDPLANDILNELIGGSAPSTTGDNGPPATGAALPSADLLADLQTAMRLTGVDPAIWQNGMEILIMHESTGNPLAYNKEPVYYSAKWGYQHAEGLCQVMPPTFEEYALPGHHDIWNPVDNIIASIRYIQADYGTINNIDGIGHGTYKNY